MSHLPHGKARRRPNAVLVHSKRAVSVKPASKEKLIPLQHELLAHQSNERALALRLQITQLLAQAKSLDEVAVTLLQTIGEALNWQLGEFYLFDESKSYAKVSAYWYQADPLLQEYAATSDAMNFPFEMGIPHRVMTTRQAVWLPDASTASDFLRASLLQRAGLRCGAAFPFQTSENICGMFFFFSREVRPPDAAQIELLNQVGSEISQFIVRTRSEMMLHQAKEELAQQVASLQETLVKINALYAIGQHWVEDLRLEELLQGIADTLLRALPADRVALIILDVDQKRVQHFIRSGPGANHVKAIAYEELWEGLSGWAIRERQAVISPKEVPDAREGPAVQLRRRETNCGAILVVPLIHQNEILGTLTAINRPDQDNFDASDLELMQVIANQAAITVERKRDQETLRYQNEFLSALNRITVDLLNHKELAELLDAIVQAATKLLDAPFGQIFLADGDALVVAAFTPNLTARRGERLSRDIARLAWKAFDTREPASVDDYATWEQRRRIHDKVQVHAAVDLPIFTNEKGIGVLALGRAQPGYFFDAEQLRYGALFAQLAAVVLDNWQLRDSLREQALHDPLTGLYNRRYMQDTLERELPRAQRTGAAVAIILLDLDHFKSINDTFGHQAGDSALQEIGAFLKSHLRAGDIACRYGGEEFLLILPGATLGAARRRAEELRVSLQAQSFAYDGIVFPPLTCSLGVAVFPQHAHDSDALINCADEALYRAKQAGRNRVELASYRQHK